VKGIFCNYLLRDIASEHGKQRRWKISKRNLREAPPSFLDRSGGVIVLKKTFSQHLNLPIRINGKPVSLFLSARLHSSKAVTTLANSTPQSHPAPVFAL
jgi:hypothetical protein